MAKKLLDKITDFDLSQIVNGEEIMGPSPMGVHQKIVGTLHLIFADIAKKNNSGEVFISPLDVIFEEGYNRLQPDLIYLKKENLHLLQDWIRGVPDLVIEVVSKGSLTFDTVTKKNIYEKYQVPEFWLVFPEQECIEVFIIKDGKYHLFSTSDEGGKVKSSVITGLELKAKKVFDNK
jgi:Uma2 family endonuclease